MVRNLMPSGLMMRYRLGKVWGLSFLMVCGNQCFWRVFVMFWMCCSACCGDSVV